jgi:hypothetical protein
MTTAFKVNMKVPTAIKTNKNDGFLSGLIKGKR